jgi:hypothetical protein
MSPTAACATIIARIGCIISPYRLRLGRFSAAVAMTVICVVAFSFAFRDISAADLQNPRSPLDEGFDGNCLQLNELSETVSLTVID